MPRSGNDPARTPVAGKEIWPVGKDDMLPGAGRILKIEHDQNRWQVFAARMVITGERQ